MRSQQRHRGSHPRPGPHAASIVCTFQIACKVSDRELELPLGDPSPSADFRLLRPSQQRTELERTKAGEGVGERSRHTRAANPSAPTPPPPPSPSDPLPRPPGKSGLCVGLFVCFSISALCRIELGSRTPSLSPAPFQEKLGSRDRTSLRSLSLAPPPRPRRAQRPLAPGLTVTPLEWVHQ